MPALPHVLLPALLCAVVFGCRRPATYQYQAPEAAVSTPAQPEMVFLSFKATSDGTKPATISLLQSTVVAGPLKDTRQYEPVVPAYLVVSQLDAAQQPISSAVVEHPLLKAVESFGDDQQPGRRTVALQEAEFFVRMLLAPQATGVRVEEFVNDKKTSTTDFPLPPRP